MGKVIQINLLPVEERVSEPRLTFKAPRSGVWVPAVIAAVVLLPLGGTHVIQQARIGSLKSDIQAAEVEMRTLKPQVDRIRQLAREREDLNLRLAIIQDLSRGRYHAVETMDQVSDEVPGYLWLTRLAQGGTGQLTVEGLTFSNLMVAELMSRMEQSELFSDVALVVAERAKQHSQTDRPVLSFTLTAKSRP